MKFKHRANKETTILSPKTALIVQALKALGEKNVDDNAVKVISNYLCEKEKNKILREAMYVTDWVYEVLKNICQLEIQESE